MTVSREHRGPLALVLFSWSLAWWILFEGILPSLEDGPDASATLLGVAVMAGLGLAFATSLHALAIGFCFRLHWRTIALSASWALIFYVFVDFFLADSMGPPRRLLNGSFTTPALNTPYAILKAGALFGAVTTFLVCSGTFLKRLLAIVLHALAWSALLLGAFMATIVARYFWFAAAKRLEIMWLYTIPVPALAVGVLVGLVTAYLIVRWPGVHPDLRS